MLLKHISYFFAYLSHFMFQIMKQILVLEKDNPTKHIY